MEKSEKKSSLYPKNDWDVVLKFLCGKEKGVNEKLTIDLANDRLINLPLDKAKLKLKNINSIAFYKCLEKVAKPVLFSKKQLLQPNIMIIKFTGPERYEELIKNITEQPDFQNKASIIISPNNLTKKNRIEESHLVNITRDIFESTCFIKLPMKTINEYLEFAQHEKATIILMPFKDLLSYVELIKDPSEELPIIQAAFQPV